ncbi:MAG TPA: TonB-dependent receptor [Gammaproteobacteria bacterium]|nr:TonB-dependent receptor [Gammaproteobacteria bacterium]
MEHLASQSKNAALIGGRWWHQTATCIFLVGITGSAGANAIDQGTSAADLSRMSIEDLANIQVTSVSKRPEPLSNAAASIYVITGDDIRRAGATSLPEALRLAPNLEVAQKNAHDWAITARGFNTDLANKLLVLIDGRTVYTPLFSGVFWDRQDYLLEDIDRIEVISGPGSTLWGANAVNGVINIITKSAKDTQGAYLEGGGGSELQGFGGGRYGAKLAPDVYIRGYGKYFDRDNEVLTNGKNASDSWNMGQGGFRLDAEVSPQNNLTLQGDYYDGDENLATGGDAGVSGNNILGRWSHTFSSGSDMSLQFYYDRTHLSDPTPASVAGPLVLAPPGVLKDDLDTYDVDFQHRLHLGDRNSIVWGLGYRFTSDVVGNSPGLAFIPPVLEHDLFSGFVQDEIALWDSLTFTLGTKVEHNDYTGFEFEPSARLAWTFAERQTLWAAVSRAVRIPSRVDRDERLPTPNFAPFIQNLLIGGADFASETVIAYELGYRAQLGSKVNASVSGFYNDYDNIRSTSLTPVTVFPLFFENNLKGDTYGFEFSGTYQALDWWRLRVGYNLLKEDIFVRRGRTDFNNAFNETADPQQQFSLRSSMDLPYSTELDVGLRWVDELPTNNSGIIVTVPDYVEMDARLGWRLTKNIELSIVGQNLLHDHHQEYIISSPNPSEDIQRAVLGKVSLRF